MRYKEIISIISSEKGRREFAKRLDKSSRNSRIDVLRDYYDGYQWNLTGMNSQTRSTRRGAVMWKPLDPKRPGLGFTSGELKTWNMIKPAQAIYSTYARGSDKEDVKVVVRDSKGEVIEDKSSTASAIFPDINQFVMDGVVQMGRDSAVGTKISEAENDLLQKIGNIDSKEFVSFVDVKELEPLYWHKMIRGYIRFYKTTVEELKALGYDKVKAKGGKVTYWEVVYYDDKGAIQMSRFANHVMLEEGKAPNQEALPYAMEFNGGSENEQFDVETTAESDVQELLELQDHLNKHITSISIIFDKVAHPMLALNPEWYKDATDSDIDRMKENLSNLSTAVGSIIIAPIEKMPAEGISPSQDRHIQDIFQQYFIITGIPKSVFNSEGLASSSGIAISQLFESLKRVVGKKRTIMSRLIEKNVLKVMDLEKGETVDVIYPPMIDVDATSILEVMKAGYDMSIFPTEYLQDKGIELLGDSDKASEIIDQMTDQEQREADEIKMLMRNTADKREQKKKEQQQNKVAQVEGRVNNIVKQDISGQS